MDTATQAPYTIRATDGTDRPDPRTPVGSADDIHSALNAAWALNRFTESPVQIIDNRDGEPRLVAVVSVEWLDGE